MWGGWWRWRRKNKKVGGGCNAMEKKDVGIVCTAYITPHHTCVYETSVCYTHVYQVVAATDTQEQLSNFRNKRAIL